MGRSGLSRDEWNNSAELRDIFSHLIDWINCLWNALATLDSESLFISFQMNWDWFGSWHLLLYTQKEGDIFSSLITNLGIILVKLRWNCISLSGEPGHVASQEWLIFLISMIFDMIQVIVIHQICFQLPMSLSVFSLLACLWYGLMIFPRTQLSWYIFFCSWVDTLTEFFCCLFLWASMILPPPSWFIFKLLALKNTLRCWNENLKSK